MENCILIHYGEIGLKGKNRGFFEKKLVENIRSLSGLRARRVTGRIEADWPSENPDAALKTLSNIFGISSYSPAVAITTDLAAIKKGALDLIKRERGKTFKAETKRSYKQFALNSMEISRELGAHILKNTDLKVDVKTPDIILSAEVLKNKTYIYTRRIDGPGGLPVGVSGKMLVLISGGIDSPAAAYLMMKRGASLDFVHFHSYPHTDKASTEKVKEILKVLGKYQKNSTLYQAPIIDFQKEVLKKSADRYRVILYRRLMYKVAEKIARADGAKALVSGDNLGQVASQTIENIAVISNGISLPIMRPLIGFDKEEIISLAKKIGTYDISIEPQGDCCSVFLPKSPATKARLEDVVGEERKINMEKWVNKVIKTVV